jgi:sulfopyruvate decarboxylase subunit beta
MWGRGAQVITLVSQNGSYEANGGHPIPGLSRLDFAGMAKSAGYRRAESFLQIEDFRRAIPGVLQAEGPVFVNLHLEPADTPAAADYDYIHDARARREFAGALALR